MTGISRRTAIGGGAALAGMWTSSAGVGDDTYARLRAGSGAARRSRPAVVPLCPRGGTGEAIRRWLGEGVYRSPVPGLGNARGRSHAARPRRASRTPLARQRRRMGIRRRRPLPGHHHRSRRSLRDGRLRARRRLVSSPRPWPFHPGDRRQALPLPPGLRQRLLLGVRHLLDQRLGWPRSGRGAGEEFRRPGEHLRRLPEEGGLHLERAGPAAASGGFPAGVACLQRPHPPLPLPRPEAGCLRRG